MTRRRISLPRPLDGVVLLAALAACGGDKAPPGASAGDSGAYAMGDAQQPAVTPDAGTRSFRMATTGEQLLVTGPGIGLQLTPADIASDADITAVHQEVYGLPWAAFAAGTQPPAEWSALMARIAGAARTAGTGVFLSLTMLDGNRQYLSPSTVIQSGTVKTQDETTTSCYDFRTAPDAATRRAAYLAYVDYMVGVFSPAYLDVAVEVNLFFEHCPAAAPGLIDVIDAVYAAQKAKNPAMLIFPSFQIDHLYGYSTDSCPDPTRRSACFDDAYAVIAPISRDRFAMSSYPYLSGITSAGALPSDWFTRGPGRAGERGLVSETGWLSTGLTAQKRDGTCTQVFTFDPSAEAGYLKRVLSDAAAAPLDLVTWWADRDLEVSQVMTDCPCTFDSTWCAVVSELRGPPSTGTTDTQFVGELLMKAFGTMGLRDYAGAPKPAVYGPWSEASLLKYEAR